jgi:hypothetical protein
MLSFNKKNPSFAKTTGRGGERESEYMETLQINLIYGVRVNPQAKISTS